MFQKVYVPLGPSLIATVSQVAAMKPSGGNAGGIHNVADLRNAVSVGKAALSNTAFCTLAFNRSVRARFEQVDGISVSNPATVGTVDAVAGQVSSVCRFPRASCAITTYFEGDSDSILRGFTCTLTRFV